MKTTANMGFSAMLAEEYILIVPFAYRLYHGTTFLRNIINVYSAVAFYLSLITRLTNHGTCLPAGRYQHSRKP